MKSKVKKQILKTLSKNLEMFYPEHRNSFMCPTCMNVIPINNLSKITEAHIIPKASGGKLKTFLCKDCNNKFGTKQDKWFGEIIRIANDPNASIFSTAIKDKYFIINGIKVNGHWEENQNGNFTFDIHIDRNSPQTNKLINKKFEENLSRIELSVPMPILRNQRMIDIGYLTAAYLMWFGLLGYSWVLQRHLDPIREQITNPEKEIIKSKYLLTVNSVNWEPWVGVVSLFGDVVPAFGLKKHMVILPPRDQPKYYDVLKTFETEINLSDIKPLKLPKKPSYGPPLIVLFENRLVVGPRTSKDSVHNLLAILFTKDCQEGKFLRQIDKRKFEELNKIENVKRVSIKIPH